MARRRWRPSGWNRTRLTCCLVDLNMPLKNGWATLDRLIEVNPSLPVLIVTGQPNQFELAEAAGVSALVEKPIDVPALLLLIQELLAGPAESRLLPAGHREFPFQHLRAAGYASRYSWTGTEPHSLRARGTERMRLI